MPLNRKAIKNLLEAHKFADLFIEHLGWDHPASDAPVVIEIGETRYALQPVAHKRGFLALHCPCIPDAATRAKLETKVSRDIREHLVIFAADGHQRWQWVRRVPGQPLSRKEHEYLPNQPQLLIEKIGYLAVGVDEEENIDLVDVLDRVKSALDVDRVTKRFYERFKKEHDAFLKFIEGIADLGDARWYASVMLNRLMFIYFIQKKGFLDGDTNYLRNRLQRVQALKGTGKFHTFYRYFLMKLCHEVLAKKDRQLDKDLASLIGQVPYLNGGIFEPHEIEQKYGEAISIPDEAFAAVFDFFDQYEWHLDNRPVANADEINPDVLGYIFEKYINQKQMGAYYTKEDITEYISKNTILPCLFDKAKKACKIAFEGETAVWNLLKDDPDRYIYPAVRHGVTCDVHSGAELAEPVPYPPEIEIGLDTTKPDLLERRKAWNRPTPPEAGLPTEIWRETVARRQRYAEIRGKLECGEVREINDLITLNLDIRQFAQDVIERCESPDLLNAFWVAIAGRLPQNANEEIKPGLTVLDPTCGSGAFLFAALNILEPLYEACLERMKGFLEEWGAHPKHSNYAKFFQGIREEIGKHPSPKYYIYKSIIIHNLFGVDLMKEAVEICKLRLFLKLVAQVDDGARIEPLPDIDFNIRAGNTLVGFATQDEMKRAMQGDVFAYNTALPEILEQAEDCDRLFNIFRQAQLDNDATLSAAKARLSAKLREINDRLNLYLAQDYGIKSSTGGTPVLSKSSTGGTPVLSKSSTGVPPVLSESGAGVPPASPAAKITAGTAVPRSKTPYEAFLESHQPFHWFIEFYGIMKTGGFDAIIGNPPYVENKEVKKEYRIRGYMTEECGNLYAFVYERAVVLANLTGIIGLIIPVASASTEGYAPLRHVLLRSGNLVVSSFNDRPGKLFDGIEHIRLSIILLSKCPSSARSVHSSSYLKWFTETRDTLFQTLSYSGVNSLIRDNDIPKCGFDLESKILEKLPVTKRGLSFYEASTGEARLYYTRKLSYFVQILDFVPNITDGEGVERPPSELKVVKLPSREMVDAYLCALNSTLFYWLLTVWSDCRNLNKREVYGIPFDPECAANETKTRLSQLADSLMADFAAKSNVLDVNYKSWGKMSIQCIYPKHSKPIIDEIDKVLAQHYGFTEEELDYIINYDIKYRMGKDLQEDGE